MGSEGRLLLAVMGKHPCVMWEWYNPVKTAQRGFWVICVPPCPPSVASLGLVCELSVGPGVSLCVAGCVCAVPDGVPDGDSVHRGERCTLAAVCPTCPASPPGLLAGDGSAPPPRSHRGQAGSWAWELRLVPGGAARTSRQELGSLGLPGWPDSAGAGGRDFPSQTLGEAGGWGLEGEGWEVSPVAGATQAPGAVVLPRRLEGRASPLAEPPRQSAGKESVPRGDPYPPHPPARPPPRLTQRPSGEAPAGSSSPGGEALLCPSDPDAGCPQSLALGLLASHPGAQATRGTVPSDRRWVGRVAVRSPERAI